MPKVSSYLRQHSKISVYFPRISSNHQQLCPAPRLMKVTIWIVKGVRGVHASPEVHHQSDQPRFHSLPQRRTYPSWKNGYLRSLVPVRSIPVLVNPSQQWPGSPWASSIRETRERSVQKLTDPYLFHTIIRRWWKQTWIEMFDWECLRRSLKVRSMNTAGEWLSPRKPTVNQDEQWLPGVEQSHVKGSPPHA